MFLIVHTLKDTLVFSVLKFLMGIDKGVCVISLQWERNVDKDISVRYVMKDVYVSQSGT
jgi:hypothetical protein